MTEDIDRNIAALRDTVAPSVQAGPSIRARSGTSGLDKLAEFTVPMEAEFSPGGSGRLKLAVAPTQLMAGPITSNRANLPRFGSAALALGPGTNTAGLAFPAQSAQGVGLDAALTFPSLRADLGTTPAGFRTENAIGGLEYAPQLGDNLRLRLQAERRAVNDSLLSYGGALDPRTGLKWGGETRDRAHGNLEFSAGPADLYLGGGAASIRGTHVATNSEYEFGGGGSVPVFRATGQELRVGLDLVHLGYARNLRYFTLGQGGYFSPQSYTTAQIPLTWRETVDEDLSYELGASVGYQTYRERASQLYPADPGLQFALIAQQANPATAVPGLQTSYAGQSRSGFAGSGHATVDYRIAPNLHIGGKLNVQHAGNYDEASGQLYARYLFNAAQ